MAGLIRAPSALSPWCELGRRARPQPRRAAAHARGGLHQPRGGAARARRARFRITAQPARLADARSGYAKEFLRQQFRERVGDDHPPDWKVHTTFLPAVQAAAERGGGRRPATGWACPACRRALVALDPQTGDILALVGGRDFGASPFNRAVRSRRQPGSAFKPFVYAAALERGLSPVSVLADLHAVTAPRASRSGRRATRAAKRPDAQTLREALLESNNQAAVALQQKVGHGRRAAPGRRRSGCATCRTCPRWPSAPAW